MDEQIKELKEKAEALAELAEAGDRAHKELEEAETELLERVVGMVRPALGALSSKIQQSEETHWPSGASCADVTEEFFEERGVCLTGSPGPSQDHNGNVGKYEGSDLFLTEDGSWLLVEYFGHWSRYQGESEEWHTHHQTLPSREVVQKYNIEELITELLDHLAAQLQGKREERIKHNRRRTERLRAILKLL